MASVVNCNEKKIGEGVSASASRWCHLKDVVLILERVPFQAAAAAEAAEGGAGREACPAAATVSPAAAASVGERREACELSRIVAAAAAAAEAAAAAAEALHANAAERGVSRHVACHKTDARVLNARVCPVGVLLRVRAKLSVSARASSVSLLPGESGLASRSTTRSPTFEHEHSRAHEPKAGTPIKHNEFVRAR